MRRTAALLVAVVLLVAFWSERAGKAEFVQETPPSSIDATGTADVTDALNAWLRSVPDASTVDFPADARYRVEGTLLLQSRRALTIDGHGATVFATTTGYRERAHVRMEGGSNITIRNLVVHGANPHGGVEADASDPALEAQHGFDVQGTVGVVLESDTVTDVWGDFVYFGNQDGAWAQHAIVRNCTFLRNGRQGISVTSGQDIVIDSNIIADVRFNDLDLEPNSADGGAMHVQLSNNEVGAGRLLFVGASGAGSNVGDVRIVGNRLHRPLAIQVRGDDGAPRRPGWLIEGNDADTVFSSSVPALRFSHVSGVAVSNNHAPLDPDRSMTGVSFTDSCNGVAAGNRFDGAARETSGNAPPCLQP